MSLIEGIGDEVLYMSALLFIVFLVVFAWTSTWVRPLWNQQAVWLVQLQTWPTTRVLQVLHLNEAETARLGTQDTNTRTIRMDVAEPSRSVSPTVDARQAASEILSAALEASPNLASPQQTSASNCTCTIIPNANAESDSGNSGTQETSTSESVVLGSEQTTAAPGSHSEASFLGDTRIRLKFLDETQRLVGAWLQQTVGDFKRLHFESDVQEGKAIRLIYQGQLLRDDTRSLASYGLHDNCIVHCHVSNTPYTQPINNNDVNNANLNGRPDRNGVRLDPGRFVFIIFAFKFVGIWFLYLSYPQYFDFASFFSLVLCSVIYLAFLFGNTLRARREREATDRVNVLRDSLHTN